LLPSLPPLWPLLVWLFAPRYTSCHAFSLGGFYCRLSSVVRFWLWYHVHYSFDSDNVILAPWGTGTDFTIQHMFDFSQESLNKKLVNQDGVANIIVFTWECKDRGGDWQENWLVLEIIVDWIQEQWNIKKSPHDYPPKPRSMDGLVWSGWPWNRFWGCSCICGTRRWRWQSISCWENQQGVREWTGWMGCFVE